MTREKAIEILKRKTTIPNDGEDFDYISEAFDIAIKALEEPCEDCISRQDAIKKVSEILKGVFVEYEDIAQKAIGSLPTVNPQPCEDAISREDALMALTGEWTEPTDELIHRFIRRIKNLPSVNPQQTKWIPVSERLPEENKTVMASTKFGVYPEVRYSKEYGWEWAYEAGADYWEELKATVTAWMPLPQPYEPQESEEV